MLSLKFLLHHGPACVFCFWAWNFDWLVFQKFRPGKFCLFRMFRRNSEMLLHAQLAYTAVWMYPWELGQNVLLQLCHLYWRMLPDYIVCAGHLETIACLQGAQAAIVHSWAIPLFKDFLQNVAADSRELSHFNSRLSVLCILSEWRSATFCIHMHSVQLHIQPRVHLHQCVINLIAISFVIKIAA